MAKSPTHFLALPLHRHAPLTTALGSFRADVTSPTSFALPDAAVRPPGTLHLTLGVMSLPQQSNVDAAVGLLRQIKVQTLLQTARERVGQSAHGPLSIHLRGLRAIGSEDKATVLYVPPEDSMPECQGLLHSFASELKAKFVEAGIMENETRPMLLHATVFNTIYVKGRKKTRGKDRLMIDARDLLARYEDFVWAEDLEIGEVGLYKMGAQAVEGTDDVEYVAEARVSLVDKTAGVGI